MFSASEGVCRRYTNDLQQYDEVQATGIVTLGALLQPMHSRRLIRLQDAVKDTVTRRIQLHASLVLYFPGSRQGSLVALLVPVYHIYVADAGGF